jgi:glycosyltransferase involved in cell wall biosynthesis
MEIKKMLLVYNSSLDLDNGSNTHVLELSKNLSTNLDLLLVSPKGRNSSNFSFIKEINVFSQKKVDSISYQIVYQVGLFKTLLVQCLTNKPDIIYERQCGWSFIPALVAKVFRIPYIVELNGLLIDELKMGNFPKIYVKISALNERNDYNISNKIITVTQGIKDEIMKLYKIPDEKIVVINNGVNTNIFYPFDQNEAQTRLKLEHSKDYICFVGNLAPWQGIEYLIRASPIVLKKHPKASFLIVGDGVLKNELVQLTNELGVSDKLIFTGNVPYNMVPVYINAADICVVPKKPIKSGYSPLKLYEYMSCGKPIIATNTTGFEILEENNSGLLTDSENPVELANSILKLLSNPKLMSEMGANGRRCAVEKHSWDCVAKKVRSVCNDVIKNYY